MNFLESWVVGIILVFLFLKVIRGKFKGLPAILLITVIPYVLGSIVLKVIGYHH